MPSLDAGCATQHQEPKRRDTQPDDRLRPCEPEPREHAFLEGESYAMGHVSTRSEDHALWQLQGV